jgi:hypothetical protein
MDIAESTYSQCESGQRRVSLNAALRLAVKVNVSLNWLFLGRGTATIAEAVKAEQPKRKPGRPKGSKNKPKSKPPINRDPYRFL